MFIINNITYNNLLLIKLISYKDMYLKKGDKAPSFKILNQNNAMISLSDFKNQKILLWFFPKANTPG